MKKVWRGFAAAVSAAAIAATGFIGATSAYADDPAPATTTITIKGAVTGDAFSAYHVLNLTNSGDKNENFSYTINPKYQEVLATASGLTFGADPLKNNSDIYGYINRLDANGMRDFANALFDAIAAEKSIAADETTTTGAFTDVPQGYYLIRQTAAGDTQPQQDLSLVILNTGGNAAVEVSKKNGTPTLEKKVQDKNDSTDTADTVNGWQDSADYDLGDDVPFQLTGTVGSNIAEYTYYKYVFHDTLSNGLTLNQNSIKVTIDGTVIASDKYVVAVDGQTFTVTFENLKNVGVEITNATNVVVTYTARLNDKANIGSTGNPNTANLEFANDPHFKGDADKQPTDETPEDVVIVFTYEYIVDKTFPEGNVPDILPTFTLYKYIGDVEKKIADVQVKDNGKAATPRYTANFPRIDDGRYVVKESIVPDGFNKAADVYFQVSATHEESSDNPTLTNLAVTYYTDGTFTSVASGVNGAVDTTHGTVQTTIANTTGKKLPSTGGMGTTILYAAGAAIVLIAGIGLAVTLRRRQA